MVKGNDTLHFYYDSNNSPIAFTRNNTIPYFQVKFGYTWVWYWNIKKTKNNKSFTKSIWWIPNSKVKLTKNGNYTNIYVN